MSSSLPSSEQLRRLVHQAYSEAALHPQGHSAFPIGRAFAEDLGYPRDLLKELPAAATEAFTGVSCISLVASIRLGDCVLDLGCGAGLDSLIMARRIGSEGRVVAVDFSEAMLARARQAQAEARAWNIVLCKADAEDLPLPDNSVDVALVNGLFNLNPKRDAIFRELARVVRPGGRVFAAELILSEPLPAEAQTPANWFA